MRPLGTRQAIALREEHKLQVRLDGVAVITGGLLEVHSVRGQLRGALRQ